MAGLQYNFFPTDFFFPPQNTIHRDSTSQQINLSANTRMTDENLDDSKPLAKPITNTKSTTLKAAISSSSIILAPISKQRQNQGQDQAIWLMITEDFVYKANY